ncbi:MAG: serine hydroxymethyltransferase [Gemmatimonadetes bacterium]|nr:serine hydroxymethyltransferase [Gemmatimonadota bacterium]
MLPLTRQDPEIARLIAAETRRQEDYLELIASENFTSLAVLQATGSTLTNKYAEGLPRKRYYGGCEVVDQVEQLAIDRALELFGAEHANVQPHSGSSANLAAYLAILKPGDRILGMNLSHGGHLTHGSPVNFSGMLFEVSAYGVRREDGRIDYDALAEQAREVRPRMIIGGSSAYARVFDWPRMRAIADEVDALFVVDVAHYAGLVAGGAYPSPVPHAHIVTSTTHKTLRGPRSGLILSRKEHAKAIDKMVFPGTQGGPLMHVIAAKAVCFAEARTPEFSRYAHQVVANARTLAETLAEAGYHAVSGGTDSHLFLLDLTEHGKTGKEAEAYLDRCGITVNKNTVPFETQSPFVTSGIRIGTPALTTRGMREDEMREVGRLIARALAAMPNESEIEAVRARARELAAGFPIYADLAESAA